MAKSLVKSTLIFSAMTMLSRIMGLVRDVSLASVFGAGGLMDAFWIAFKIPNFFRRLFAEGAFSQAFVPVLTEYKTKFTKQEVQILISRVAGSLTAFLLPLTIVVMVFAPVIIGLFAPGFINEPQKFNTAVELLRLTFPYLLFISLTAFAGSILNTYGSFASAAFSPVLLNICMIFAALVAAPYFNVPVMALGWAILIAGLLQFAIQLPELYHKGLLSKPKIDFKHDGVKRIFQLMMPALFGVSVVQINLLLNTVWASFMQTGSVTWMTTAERLTELPLGLIGVAIGSVILPSLSASHAENNPDRFKKLMDWAARVVILVGVPASIAMFMLATPMINVLFEHGKFTAHDTQMNAWGLQAMAANILAFMLIKIFAPGFYAQQNTKTPVKIGLIAVVVNIVLSAGLVQLYKIMGWTAAPHTALSIASTTAAFVNCTLLYMALHKAKIFSFNKQWLKIGFSYLVGNVLMVITLLYGLQMFNPSAGFWQRLLILLLLCVSGATAYAIGLLLTGFKPQHLKPQAV